MSEESKEKSIDRLEILKRIEQFEIEGKFDLDVENDPPTIVLTQDKVDYLRKKSINKLKTIIANKAGEKFFNTMVKENKLIIKEVTGIEYLEGATEGGIITCNHFNPFDSFTVESVFKSANIGNRRKLFKVIREGNYTNFPGFYGFLFKNCNTLPLSSSMETMKKFINAVDEILNKKNFILIYPEQSMWWNYKKPKPLKDGAFKFAVNNDVPVIPIFITLKESDLIGDDGFPIMEYYVHIEKPIYKDKDLTNKENIQKMRDENFNVWKKVYEEFYGIPLEYTTIKNGEIEK